MCSRLPILVLRKGYLIPVSTKRVIFFKRVISSNIGMYLQALYLFFTDRLHFLLTSILLTDSFLLTVYWMHFYMIMQFQTNIIIHQYNVRFIKHRAPTARVSEWLRHLAAEKGLAKRNGILLHQEEYQQALEVSPSAGR